MTEETTKEGTGGWQGEEAQGGEAWTKQEIGKVEQVWNKKTNQHEI